MLCDDCTNMKLKLGTTLPVARVMPQMLLTFTQAMIALQDEISPFDCHADIEPHVAFVMGFYAGAAELNHSGIPTAITMLRDDLASMIMHVVDHHKENE